MIIITSVFQASIQNVFNNSSELNQTWTDLDLFKFKYYLKLQVFKGHCGKCVHVVKIFQVCTLKLGLAQRLKTTSPESGGDRCPINFTKVEVKRSSVLESGRLSSAFMFTVCELIMHQESIFPKMSQLFPHRSFGHKTEYFGSLNLYLTATTAAERWLIYSSVWAANTFETTSIQIIF